MKWREVIQSTKIGFFVIFLFFIFHFSISSSFGPTWDFPHHLKIGEMRLGISNSYPFTSYPYGFITDVVPVFIAESLPTHLQPSSYFYLSIVSGFIGVLFFYLLLSRYFGNFIALFSALLLLSIPRFIGHLHVNMKDMGSASFFIPTLYFFLRFCEEKKFLYAFFSVLFFTLAVNTKFTVYQLMPLFILGLGVNLYTNRHVSHKMFNEIKKSLLYLVFLIFVPLFFWVLLWPHRQFPFFQSLGQLRSLISMYTEQSPFYAFTQLFETTPLPALLFSLLGIGVCVYDFIKKRKLIFLLFPVLFVYTLFKYPLFRLPIIDDIRYFLDIYFAMAFLTVYFLFRVFKRYSFFPIVLLIFFCAYRSWEIHPYQITYANFLSQNEDKDFWASSYKEVFLYINKTAPKNTTISVRLAPELAYYLIRDDLRKNLNSKTPSASDYVVILSRPSYFELFRMEDFVQRNTPTKIFKSKNGVPMTYFYGNTR